MQLHESVQVLVIIINVYAYDIVFATSRQTSYSVYLGAKFLVLLPTDTVIWYISDETSFKGVEKVIMRLLVSVSLNDPTYGEELLKKNKEIDIQYNSVNCCKNVLQNRTNGKNGKIKRYLDEM